MRRAKNIMRLRKNTHGKCHGAYISGKRTDACMMWEEKKKEYESASRLRNAWVTYSDVHTAVSYKQRERELKPILIQSFYICYYILTIFVNNILLRYFLLYNVQYFIYFVKIYIQNCTRKIDHSKSLRFYITKKLYSFLQIVSIEINGMTIRINLYLCWQYDSTNGWKSFRTHT